MIYQEKKSIVVSVQALIHAIYSMLKQGHPTSPSPIDPKLAALVERLVAISYGKYYIGTGSQGVSLARGGGRRNCISIEESMNPYLEEPAVRVVRSVRLGGPDNKPQFTHAEEQRWQLHKERGMLVCPILGCAEVFPRLDDLVVHIMFKIYSVDNLVCPLCPVALSPWNFHSVVQGVQHILRHLSQSTYYREQAVRKAQCPYCLKLQGGVAKMLEHVIDVHIRTLEVRTAAVLTGIANVDDVEATEKYLQTSARHTDQAALQDLPKTYHKLQNLIDRSASLFRWTTTTLSDPRQLPNLLPGLSEVVEKSVVTIGSQQPAEKWYQAYIAPQTDTTGNQRRKGMFQALVQMDQDGNLLCPLSDDICGCGAYLPNSEAACHHIGEVLKTRPASEQVCPWCPPPKNAIAIFKSAGKFHHNDVRHLQRHLPKDCCCRHCDHKSASAGDLLLHVKKVHHRFACMVQGCFEHFANAIDLAEHAEEHGENAPLRSAHASSTQAIAALANELVGGSDSDDVSTIARSDSGTSVGTISPDFNDLKRPIACEGCRRLKQKCEFNRAKSITTCERCAKAGRRCVVTAPSRKRPKNNNDRVAEPAKKTNAKPNHAHCKPLWNPPARLLIGAPSTITLQENGDSDDDIRGPRKRIRRQSTDTQGADDENTHDADDVQLHNPMLDEQDAMGSGDSDIDGFVVDDDASVVFDTDASENDDDTLD